jgi:hypothetical protein
VTAPSPRPELGALSLSDRPERWEELGFAVRDGVLELGGVRIELGVPGTGITAWRVRGIEPVDEIDGLPTEVTAEGAALDHPPHPNGAVGLDHVVVITPDFDRTAGALAAAGMPLRREREGRGGVRQGFRRLGPTILELVQSPDAPDGPARFWGLVVIVADLEALAERLGEHLGEVKDAVQPGRRIAPLRSSGGLDEAVAFMSPEPKSA